MSCNWWKIAGQCCTTAVATRLPSVSPSSDSQHNMLNETALFFFFLLLVVVAFKAIYCGIVAQTQYHYCLMMGARWSIENTLSNVKNPYRCQRGNRFFFSIFFSIKAAFVKTSYCRKPTIYVYLAAVLWSSIIVSKVRDLQKDNTLTKG